MEMKSQLMIGGGALLGLIGLYFAWNFYSEQNNELIVGGEEENEIIGKNDNIESKE